MSLILYTVLLLHCGQASKAPSRDVTLPDGRTVKHVEVRISEDGGKKVLDVDYPTMVKEQCQIQSEARDVFDAYVKGEAQRLGAKAIDMWPKLASGVTHNFYWVRVSGETWKEELGFKTCK